MEIPVSYTHLLRRHSRAGGSGSNLPDLRPRGRSRHRTLRLQELQRSGGRTDRLLRTVRVRIQYQTGRRRGKGVSGGAIYDADKAKYMMELQISGRMGIDGVL